MGSCNRVGPWIVGFGGFDWIWLVEEEKRKEEENSGFDMPMNDEFERGSGPKFTYNQLSRSTNNFAEEYKLGEGGFGGVYKGFLRELNSYVAVKRISKGSKQGIKEYASTVKIISRLRHRNLVQLIGWCQENSSLSMSSWKM
ncbi:unnamed protein product [Thlaspi arvense]|uniref:Protein kinase domain-containing protein n=1 Tax=Thlaspi arvense TaxID=13288 RepID=A0AAU9RMM2_THLAR|nr:unnamed protein product [Thlaspi arvense]